MSAHDYARERRWWSWWMIPRQPVIMIDRPGSDLHGLPRKPCTGRRDFS